MRKILEDLDLAPAQYYQTINGKTAYKSAYCGCFSLLFWLVIILTLYYQVSAVAKG